MQHTALYRKYRPESFDDVLGQDHIVKVLRGSLELGNVSHAYLFFGSRGTGKTSIARIIARELGTSANDLYEIDAASNRGIDDIRELRESVRTLPFDSGYKVYIIDEVHMLTKEAFNALLKTLEEPPAHVIFILATTELDKVPETIVSRCQVFTFRRPNHAVLKELALSVAEKEGFSLSPEGAELIALLGEGSFRDTHGVVQKVTGFSKDKKISTEEVEEVLGAPKGELVHSFIRALAEGDREKALRAVRSAEEENIDMRTYLKLVLHKLRLALLMRLAPNMRKEISEEVGEDEGKFLADIASSKSKHLTSASLRSLIQAYQELKSAAIPSLPVELALADILGDD